MATYQTEVNEWVSTTFGKEIAKDVPERVNRFFEEAVELAQSLGCSELDAHTWVAYVFGRPKGEPAQEIGGCMITLHQLATAVGVDAEKAGNDELQRVWENIPAIQAKHALKPKINSLIDDKAITERSVVNWLKDLQDPIRHQAIINLEPEASESIVKSQTEALECAFQWASSSEGFDYWNEIHKTL